MNNTLLIIILAVMTYLSRIIGLELSSRLNFRKTTIQFFNFVPIAVIGTLLVRQLLNNDAGTAISLPVSATCLASALSMKYTKSFLLSIVIGIGSGLLVQSII